MKGIFVCCALSVLAGNTGSFSRRVGLLNKLFEAHAEMPISDELNLSEQQCAELARCNAEFLVAHQEFIGEVMQMNRRTVADGQVPWENHRARVRKINRTIIRSTRTVISQPRKYRRYEELLTQKYLRECRFEEAAELHQLDLERGSRKKMQLMAAALGQSRVKRLSGETWRSLCQVLTVYLGASHIDDAAGEIYELPQFPRASNSDPLGVYDDLVLRLCMDPALQRELTFSRMQSRQLTGVFEALRDERILEKLNRRFQKASRTGEPVEMELAEKKLFYEIVLLNRRVDRDVRDLLNLKQRSRLDQLLFQAYVRRQDFEKALIIAGVSKKHFDRLDFGNHARLNALSRSGYEARIYLRYRRQLDKLLSGMRVFDVLVGEGGSRRLIGELVLAPEDPLLQDADIRKRLNSVFRAELAAEGSTGGSR